MSAHEFWRCFTPTKLFLLNIAVFRGYGKSKRKEKAQNNE